MKKVSVLKGLASVLSLSVLSALVPVQAQNADSALIDQYAQGLGSSTISQVSSVSELTDVDPNSFAFQALKSLVERYGCIEGYPSKVYLGNKALTRYEFAAGLNACLEKVNELIAAGTADKVTKDDLAALQRLQEEFKAELATLRGRVDALEAKVKELESQQFSTTTKLDGSVVFAVQGGGTSSGDTYLAPGQSPAFGDRFGTTAVPGNSPNTTFVARTSLNLRTSFTGSDELLIRLRGVTGQDISNSFTGIANGLGTLFYAGGPAGAFDGSSTGPVPTNGLSTVTFDKVRYTTPLFGDNFRIFIGPRIDIFEFIDTNSFANNEEVDFSSGFFINNPLVTFIFTGPGGGLDWEISDNFSIRGIYISGQGGSSTAPGGFANANNYIVAGEAEFRSGTAKLKLQYASFTEVLAGGSLLGAPLFGGISRTATIAGGVNAEWAVTPSFGIFGRYGFAQSYVLSGGAGVDYRANNGGIGSTTWQVGASIGDIFVPGSVLGIAGGQPIRAFGTASVAGVATNLAPSGTEFDIEAFYKFPINDRLTLTPDIQIITQPGNISGNPTITVGTLRAVFTF
ncbi:iron uptake porin [Anthocerotibacter panamensis]|uniref:iron uptake porin n=1 Tax=Anthocerotibacter panamensis TaxID=2857077 RepID=UPI001C407610|nr:iron uptake porin [Anthocerotibacter panamensis]